MNQSWNENIKTFIKLSDNFGVRMIMVGGWAVYHHGYKRHSADVDFWIEPNEENFKKLIQVFNKMGYDILDFPEKVKNKQQNISVKFSPEQLYLELITNFSVNKSFDEVHAAAITVKKDDFSYKLLAYDDLITSKLKSARPKDLLDVQELKRIRNTEK